MYQKSNRSPYLVALAGAMALVIVAQATADQLPAARGSAAAPIKADDQASPQGPTGPINTESGGAPAASPQGDTPAGMQAAPQGSDKAIRSPSK